MHVHPGRILSLDLGKKRIGLAVTDVDQTIAFPLGFVETPQLFPYLKNYLNHQLVSAFVLGLPLHLDGSPSPMSQWIKEFGKKLMEQFPNCSLYYQDERLTSNLAQQGLYQAGYTKKQRAKKSNIDQVSAAIILQSFLSRSKAISLP